MMRACHLNTCPVGIATQDPELRARFTGPARARRQLLLLRRRGGARGSWRRLGVATVRGPRRPRRPARGRRRDRALEGARRRPLAACCARQPTCRRARRSGARTGQESPLGGRARLAADRGRPPGARARQPVEPSFAIRNVNRTVGGLLSHRRDQARTARAGCRPARSASRCTARPGQSFGAWLAPGVELTLVGDANDYVGKGLSGGTIAVRPPRRRGVRRRGERDRRQHGPLRRDRRAGVLPRASRASGSPSATRAPRAVVEGVGDHGCEYMTGGRVVVLGPTGRNFAAGMSGGIAYVLDDDGSVRRRAATLELVELEALEADDVETIRALVAEHCERTGSTGRRRACSPTGSSRLPQFVKVMPHDYKRALADLGDRARRPPGLDAAAAASSRPRPRRRRPDGRARRASSRSTAAEPPERDPRERVARLPRVRRHAAARWSCASRARAAWSAACRSATTAARSAT